MITKPTVLVLGAGASSSYQFPFGQALLQRINEVLHPHNNEVWEQVFDHCAVSQDERQNFLLELNRSQQASVDAFLEYRPEFLKVGKLAITLALVPRENESVLLSRSHWESGFYHYLFGALNAPFDDFHKNMLSIITFNYDRSLEHYLFTALKHTHNRPDVECADKLSSIPIVHVHGSLGPLPWQSQQARPYSPSYDAPEDIFSASEKIIVMSEGQETSAEFQTAFKLIEHAARIYFLGFGYNTINMQRLGVDRLPARPQEIEGYKGISGNFGRGVGTAYHMGSTEKAAVQNKWKIVLFESTCLDFFRNYAPLD